MTDSDFSRFELRLREHFASREDLRKVEAKTEDLAEEVQAMEMGISGIKVELRNMNGNISDIKNSLAWFNRTVLGAVILAGLNIILGLAR